MLSSKPTPMQNYNEILQTITLVMGEFWQRRLDPDGSVRSRPTDRGNAACRFGAHRLDPACTLDRAGFR
jgi:hypothetical protein